MAECYAAMSNDVEPTTPARGFFTTVRGDVPRLVVEFLVVALGVLGALAVEELREANQRSELETAYIRGLAPAGTGAVPVAYAGCFALALGAIARDRTRARSARPSAGVGDVAVGRQSSWCKECT